MKKQKNMGGKGIFVYIGSSHVTFEHSPKLLNPLVMKILGLA
jgi:hypothetical protein